MEQNIPDGFTPLEAFGSFNDLTGPYYIAKRGERFVIGLRVSEKHVNGLNIAHGGLMLTLADTALSMAAYHGAPKGRFTVTSALTSDFIAPARIGDWIEAEVELLRAGRSVIFTDCKVRKDGPEGEVLLRASGSFQVLAPRE